MLISIFLDLLPISGFIIFVIAVAGSSDLVISDMISSENMEIGLITSHEC